LLSQLTIIVFLPALCISLFKPGLVYLQFPGLIVWLCMMLIIIMLGLPLIKLRNITKTERLRVGTILNAALAVLLGASMITLFLLYLFEDSFRLQNADNRLEELSETIDTTFMSEISHAYDQLVQIDNNADVLENSVWIPNILNLPENNPARPSIYPFADYYFWIGESGKQADMLTPLNKAPEVKINVSKRDYFTKHDEWFFPPDPSKKFRLESILSWRAGEHKVAMATASNSYQDPVIALTSQFYSLIDPIIPKNYGFCVIDEKGKVLPGPGLHDGAGLYVSVLPVQGLSLGHHRRGHWRWYCSRYECARVVIQD
jgi:hypothetical protein